MGGLARAGDGYRSPFGASNVSDMDYRDLPDGRLRVTAQQRDHAAAILREAVVDGRLNVDELNARLPTRPVQGSTRCARETDSPAW